MPKKKPKVVKIPTSKKTRDVCEKNGWRIIGGETYVTTYQARDVVEAAKAMHFENLLDASKDPERIPSRSAVDCLWGLKTAVDALNHGRPGFYKDIGGFIDILCTGKTDGCNCIIGIQTTSRSGMSARRKKMRTECLDAVRDWLNCGGIIYLHGWDQPGGPGKRYRLKEEQVILDGDGLQFIDAEEPKF